MRRAALLLATAAALACARAPLAGVEGELALLRDALAGCPIALPDDALRDLATYERCRLPPPVAVLVRHDYADDAVAPASWSALDAFAGMTPRATFDAQRARVVDPSGALASWIAVDTQADALLPDPVLAPAVAIPFATGGAAGEVDERAPVGRLVPPVHPERPYRPERRAQLRAAATPARPLAGLRVAVDPGHAGGPFGAFEERRFEWSPAPGAPAMVVQEGDLALRTALELRAKLAARGAEVHLSREAPGFGRALDLAALRPSAEALLQRIALDPAYAALERRLAPVDRLRLHAALALHAVRKQGRFESLRARAEGATRARADLLLSIHFNAAEPGAPVRQELVAMVAGNADASRLYNPSHRARALRAALDVDGFDASAHLGALCVKEASELLGVPVASSNHYPDHLPLVFADGATRGVDAWDGALLRYADVPAALVEGPYLTDPDELARLGETLAAPPGTAGTRTERFAEGLARCVEEFARRWREGERNPFGAEAP